MNWEDESITYYTKIITKEVVDDKKGHAYIYKFEGEWFSIEKIGNKKIKISIKENTKNINRTLSFGVPAGNAFGQVSIVQSLKTKEYSYISLMKILYLLLFLILTLTAACQDSIKSVKDKTRKVSHEEKHELAERLNLIYDEDQKYRMQVATTIDEFGFNSKQLMELANNMNRADSLNLIEVKSIIKKYGWPGIETVGNKGNSALFLVIQHSDDENMQYFLPIMRKAVENNNASSQDLALLEDRVALNMGKKQIYGSQKGYDEKTKRYYLLPLEDPMNVDKRREKMGLMPISDDLLRWEINWNLEKKAQER